MTRSFPANLGSSRAVRDLGWRPVLSPLLSIRPVRWETDMAGVGAIAFTSLNGVRAAAAATAARDLPVFAVGDATARAAREAGWRSVRSAAGDVEDLVRLILASPRPLAGRVLHLSASRPAGDLCGSLRNAGVAAERRVVYEAGPAPVGPALDRIRRRGPGDLAALLIYSPRSARRLMDILGPTSLGGRRIICISEAAAAPLRTAVDARIVVAKRPTERSMLQELGRFDRPRRGGDGRQGRLVASVSGAPAPASRSMGRGRGSS